MGRRSDAKTLLECALLGGIAAVIGAVALPAGSPYFLPLIILGGLGCVVGLGGLLWMLLYPEKKIEPPPAKPSSTTARATGGGIIELDDVASSADTFADAGEGSKITATRVDHEPKMVLFPRATPKPSKDNGKVPEQNDDN